MPKFPIFNRKVIGWALYDWANSAFPAVVATFVFAAYFTKEVAVDELTGTSQWAYAMSLSALAVLAKISGYNKHHRPGCCQWATRPASHMVSGG